MKKIRKTALVIAALQLSAALGVSSHAEAHAVHAPPRSAVAATSAGRVTPAPDTNAQHRRTRRRAADTLLPGVWGGDHIRFEVAESGATVEYDCAHETVEGKIAVDARGRFDVYGTHYEEHGGPTRPGDDARGYRVRLRGVVGGSLMRLTVTRADDNRRIGVYALTRDKEANVFKCR